MPFALRDGCRLYWRLEGAADRPVVLLLHAIGTDMGLWDRVVPYLLPEHRVLRMDLRGHGASDAPAGDYTLAMLADDAAAVLDAAGAPAAAVCGLSLGAMVAMQLALQAPDRVRALMLVCTSAAMDKTVWQTRLQRLQEGSMGAIADAAIPRFFSEVFRRNHPEFVETVRAGLLAMAPAGYAGCGAAIRDMDLAGHIDAIAVPTWLVSGTLDVSTPFEGHGDRIVKTIPGAGHTMVDAAHLAALETPGDVAAALTLFLRDVSGAMPADAYQAGLVRRRKVLGDAWVDRSLSRLTPFNSEFQALITRHAWNDIWNRPGLDARTRRLLVLTATAAQGRWEEFGLHVRSGLDRGGFTTSELKEVLLQLAIYAGIPTANTAFSEVGAILEQREKPQA